MLTRSFNGKTFSEARNDGPYTVGFAFALLEDITVYKMGRHYAVTHTGDHFVGLWEDVGSNLIASGTVLAASPSDADGYKNFTLGTPIVLTAGTRYRIAVQEYSSPLDTWEDAWTTTGYLDSVFDPNVNSCYGIGSGNSFPSGAGSGTNASYSSPTLWLESVSSPPSLSRLLSVRRKIIAA